MSDNDPLLPLRQRIDDIDSNILALISERAECAIEVAKVKQASGENNFYRPEREAQVLQKIKDKNPGPLSDEAMAWLFREIMSACLALEQKLKIAYLGPEGSFTQFAALKQFGHGVNTVSCNAIDEIFREVESGNANYGVVPVENSTEGMVNQTMDLFVTSQLKICGEVQLRIHQNLMARIADMSSIKKIYSHQQSFAQCREWLNAHMVGIDQIAVKSNAEAARLASLEPETAAIAGEAAAEIYHLQMLVRNIEDDSENTTRFLVISNQETEPSGSDKTSLLFAANNRPGSLYGLLEPFRRFGISMTRVESRPSRKGVWEYIFFVDIEGHIKDKNIQHALNDISKEASLVKVLGSYPRASLS